MKNILTLALIGLLLIGCEPEHYKLSVSADGQGSYVVNPNKSEDEEGETATITGLPDTGWDLRMWEGSLNSTRLNPLILNMDGDKEIRAVFDIPIKPNLTGTWEGREYLLTFEINQPDIFDSTLSGSMKLITIEYDTLNYTIDGFIRSTLVIMYCNRPGYYQIEYKGWLSSDHYLDGGFTQAGIYLELDLLKITDSPFPKNRLPLAINKIEE